MQFIGLVATSCVSLLDKEWEKQGRRAAVVALYLVLDFSFYIAFVGSLRTLKANWLAIKLLSLACNGYGALAPGFAYLQSTTPFAGWDGTDLEPTIVGCIFALSILYWLFSFIFAVLYFRDPRALGAISANLWIAVCYYTIQMERKRGVMQQITGSSFRIISGGLGRLWRGCCGHRLVFRLSITRSVGFRYWHLRGHCDRL
jgi:hypothetical protein